ncbi:MAG TPA: 4Fe-4S binding protein [Deltaproteobacteria bacterium]|nr:4Fe-4S binding protein [Deltaproteobacteria bacterium]HPR56061.1 4Fe-4S binding protein [Deltaproteobacteria bacterium]HXK47857.1 4Fe-4S binding protein [Deltaproteobacteria bacterium]
MQEDGRKRILVLIQGMLLVAAVVALSALSSGLWGEKVPKADAPHVELPDDTMSLRSIARAYDIQTRALLKNLSLQDESDLDRSLSDLGITPAQATRALERARTVSEEESSKNWRKIALKFTLWAVFLVMVFILMHRKAITPSRRKALYLAAAILFGVVLGSDPNPMGTVKDAIVLFGQSGAVFPPRLIAFAVFMVMVIAANKFICSWGCQLGTLQDLLFRINRTRKDTSGIMRQYKIPFVITNTARIIFFAALTLAALAWAVDIVEPIDPFKVYHPMALIFGGAVFTGVLLAASLVTYRPWCHFFCPFGLIGWLGEKFSISRIRVNYDTCIACRACEKACPSTVMGAILTRERTIPDCFACGTCIHTCPTSSISFTTGKRPRPPEGKFPEKKARRQFS